MKMRIGSWASTFVWLIAASFSLIGWFQDGRSAMHFASRVRHRTIVEWHFNKKGDFEGWTPNREVVDAKVENGVLSFKTVGDDPIWEYRLPLDFPSSPWQAIEIRMRADRDGTAEFFLEQHNRTTLRRFQTEQANGILGYWRQ